MKARPKSEIIPRRGYRRYLPCPFCGSDNIELIYQSAYFVSCEDCRARGEKVWPDVKGMDREAQQWAVRAWNRRDNKRLLNALHDAIRRPMGVVPDSAEDFYSDELARQAETRRVNR